MAPLQRVIAYAVSVTLVALLAGLLAKRRYRTCLSFVPYVFAVWLTDLLIILWPHRFNAWSFWLLKETLLTGLKIGVALEIAFRTLHFFPGARATARGLVLLILSFTLGAALAVPLRGADYGILAGELLPRVLNGTACLFIGIALVILWYRIPADPFNKTIVMGFASYLLVFTVAMNALSVLGWKAVALSGYAHSGAYLALVLFWALAAWGAVMSGGTGEEVRSSILTLAEDAKGIPARPRALRRSG